MTVLRSLGHLMEFSLDQVDVRAAEHYPVAGVYSFGRGLFIRGPIAGSETSYRKLNRLRSGQLVVSRLKAFEGALAVVPQALDGWFLSPEFPTFECREGQLDPTYLGHVCRWPEFWSMLRGTSRGIGARRERVRADDLLQLELRVPPIDEQRRVAARLGWMADRSADLRRRCDQAKALSTALAQSSVARLDMTATEKASFGWRTVTLADVLEPASDVTPVDSTERYDIAGVYSFGRGMFERASLQGAQTSYQVLHRLHTGQLVMSRLKAWEGALAVVPAKLDGWFVSPEFPTFDIPTTEVDRDYLGALVTSEPFWARLRGVSQGIGARRERVNASRLLEQVVNLPPLSAQQEIAKRLRSIATSQVLREDALNYIQALVPAALNEAFAGLS